MARKAMEMTIEIAGKVGSSLGSSFKKATGNIDDLKKQSYAAQRELSRLGREFSKGNIHQSQYAAETAKVRSQLRKLEGDMRRTKAISSSLSNVWAKTKATAKVAAIGTATAAAVAIGSSVNVASNYEAQMSKVSAISGASGKELAKMDSFALELAKSSVFTATQAGEGMEYLALAGWKSQEIMAGMPGMLNLAASGNIDLGKAADITSDTMSAFGMKAMEAGHAADVFAYAQANANTNVEQMGEALKYSAPMANQMKWSLEETAAATMVLANSGLKGSIAGQAFASSIGRLADPKRTKQLKKMNMEFFDANEKMKPLPDIVMELEKGLKGMSDKQKTATMTTLFGAEAYKHWAILLEGGSEKLRGLTKDLETSDGAAARMSAEMIDNYAGSLNLLKASIETAQIKFMKPILPVFQDLFGGLGNMLDEKTSVIEGYGKRIAGGMSDILEPFSVQAPIEVDTTHIVNWNDYADQLKANIPDPTHVVDWDAYGRELAAYEKSQKFGNMDFGEKIVYSLDTAIEKAEEWLGGSGGEAVGSIFAKLGEIGAKAWVTAFTGAVGGSIGAALEGNVTGALGLGAAAWMLGGGVAVKGAVGAGRWAMESRSARRTATAAEATRQTTSAQPTTTRATGQATQVQPTTPSTRSERRRTRTTVTAQPLPPATSPSTRSERRRTRATAITQPPVSARAGNAATNFMGTSKRVLGSVAKMGNKAMLPLALAAETFNVIRSDDKAKAGGQAVAGLAGGAGGAKIGAMIGTAIAPGIGTAIGGLIGGTAGYIGGKWAGGKAVDTVRGNDTSTATTSNNISQASFDSTQLNASANELSTTLAASNASMSELQLSTGLTANNMSLLASYTAEASETLQGSFHPLQESSGLIAHNMSALTMITGEASGMLMGSFYPLESNTNLASNNMSLLASYIGQASGWIASLHGIQSAGQRVISALGNLETRINNVPLPGGTSKRVSFDG